MYYGVDVESRSRRGREAIQILGANVTSVKVNTGTVCNCASTTSVLLKSVLLFYMKVKVECPMFKSMSSQAVFMKLSSKFKSSQRAVLSRFSTFQQQPLKTWRESLAVLENRYFYNIGIRIVVITGLDSWVKTSSLGVIKKDACSPYWPLRSPANLEEKNLFSAFQKSGSCCKRRQARLHVVVVLRLKNYWNNGNGQWLYIVLQYLFLDH